jgi:hypothetical protein
MPLQFEHDGNGASLISNPQVLEKLAQTYIDRVLEYSARLPGYMFRELFNLLWCFLCVLSLSCSVIAVCSVCADSLC